ncbi:endonuclease/exonuclease/phosphatase family protein [Leifsonia sp. NPDC058292]|uniref:endonuclease/exonuclease/phosphatase family protein n=1 Tax=Leifsonia sp. NPDC058292 TaxID=3346428 RepID=UPI0036D9D6C9
MSILRSSSGPRGVLTGLVALAVAALLLWHGMLPDVLGAASLVETFLPWLGVVVLLLGLAAILRLSLFAGLCVAAAATVWGLAFGPALLPGMGTGPAALTIASENIHADNAAAASIARDLESRDPDVIALQELDATSLGAVQAVLDSRYPHSEVVGTVGVWSKVAIADSGRLDLGLGWDRALWIDLETAVAPTRLYAVHLASVRPGQYEQRDTMLKELADTVKTDESSRIVVVGDFNTASTDRKFTPLLSELTEAADSDLGLGFTWPAEFPVARLDHALVRGLGTVSSTVLPDNGSDHRGILVGLR